MKKAKAPRVPVLENVSEVNLPKLMRAAKTTGSSRLVLDNGDVQTVAVLAESRLAVFLGGQQWVVDIVPVQCLQGRVRSLLKCPRAHEGNFQSLYFYNSELACRQCHSLRYHSTLGSSPIERARLARIKLIRMMGGVAGQDLPQRGLFKWRRRHAKLLRKFDLLSGMHYKDLRSRLEQAPSKK